MPYFLVKFKVKLQTLSGLYYALRTLKPDTVRSRQVCKQIKDWDTGGLMQRFEKDQESAIRNFASVIIKIMNDTEERAQARNLSGSFDVTLL